MNYAPIILLELDRLERFSDKYKSELMLLSKNIRNKIWTDSGSPFLALLLRTINKTFDFYFQDKSKIDLDVTCEIICILAKYRLLTNPTLDTEYYHKLLCDIHMENARVIIGKKWDNILAAEEDKRNKYSTCLFQPIKKGNILDLSYNDIELYEIDKQLDDYIEF